MKKEELSPNERLMKEGFCFFIVVFLALFIGIPILKLEGFTPLTRQCVKDYGPGFAYGWDYYSHEELCRETPRMEWVNGSYDIVGFREYPFNHNFWSVIILDYWRLN